MKQPTLIVVSGPPGSGKTTLAHALARQIRCPAICRDELKEGLVLGRVDGQPDHAADNVEVHATFFAVVGLLVERSISLVAEAAYQHRLWAAGLRPLLGRARLRIIRCQAEPKTLRARIAERLDSEPTRSRCHKDRELLRRIEAGETSLSSHEQIRLDGIPSLEVYTADEYRPDLEEIVEFALS